MKRVPRLFFKFSDRPLGIAKLPSTVQLSIGGKTSPVFRVDVQFSNVDEEQVRIEKIKKRFLRISLVFKRAREQSASIVVWQVIISGA